MKNLSSPKLFDKNTGNPGNRGNLGQKSSNNEDFVVTSLVTPKEGNGGNLIEGLNGKMTSEPDLILNKWKPWKTNI